MPGGGPGRPGDTTAAMMIPMTPRKNPRAKKPPALRFLFLAITDAITPQITGMSTTINTSIQ